ncbi:MAG: hypothetical protein A2Z88_05080 [Omnitrophica WOR_2 bacterium GWA2_47_8]|nr:MAG: hypothetical protein A2Z88_05080 [Omnitrophica WOR_2 bacterium GWA2_47_8]
MSNNPDGAGKTTNPSASDRRYLPRWEVTNRVLCRVSNDGNSTECTSRDINCSGASILAPSSFSQDQKVSLAIYLDREIIVRVDGRVLWSQPDHGKHLIGIAFEQTSKKAQDLILKYAFEINKEKLYQHWFKGWDGTKAAA